MSAKNRSEWEIGRQKPDDDVSLCSSSEDDDILNDVHHLVPAVLIGVIHLLVRCLHRTGQLEVKKSWSWCEISLKPFESPCASAVVPHACVQIGQLET